MAYKTLRNKVYKRKDSQMLALCDYNGYDYLTNGCIAEEDTELPTGKELTVLQKPDLAKAMAVKGALAHLPEAIRNGDYITLSNTPENITRKIQAIYYDYVIARYGKSLKFDTDNYYNLRAVYVFDINREAGRPVAFIMPVKE